MYFVLNYISFLYNCILINELNLIMKNFKLFLLAFFALILCGNISAQIKTKTENKSSAKKSGFQKFMSETPWTFGISGHVVDDDGKPFQNLFNPSTAWNFLYYPSRLTIDKYYKDGFSFQLEFAYNQFTSGKSINNEVIKTNWTFFSSDLNAKYDLNELMGPTNWFDPYVALGMGFTSRSGAAKPSTITSNMGLGANFWVYENLGFSLQTMAKFSMIEGTSNYLHHSVGLVYKIKSGPGCGRLGKLNRFSN